MGFLYSGTIRRLWPCRKKKEERRETLLSTYLGSLSKGDRWRKSNTTQGGCGQRHKALQQRKKKTSQLACTYCWRGEYPIAIAYPLQEHSRGHDCRRFWASFEKIQRRIFGKGAQCDRSRFAYPLYSDGWSGAEKFRPGGFLVVPDYCRIGKSKTRAQARTFFLSQMLGGKNSST